MLTSRVQRRRLPERYQRIIHRLCEYTSALIQGMQLNRPFVLRDIRNLANRGKNHCFVLASRHPVQDFGMVENYFRLIENSAKSPEETEPYSVDIAGASPTFRYWRGTSR